MIATNQFIRFLYTPFRFAVLLAVLGLARLGLAQDKAEAGPQRIGVYDSRAVAVAYAGSTFQETRIKDLQARFERARRAGDAQETARLEAEGRAWQAALERQGFGTAPVDDILAHIASELPRIQQAFGVTNLVSKWNKAELDKHPKAERVDITMSLVDAFCPNETQRRRAIEIQKKQPVKFKK